MTRRVSNVSSVITNHELTGITYTFALKGTVVAEAAKVFAAWMPIRM